MSKPNRSGLTSQQSAQLRAARFRNNTTPAERYTSNRAKNPSFCELMEQVSAGNLSHDEAVKKLQEMQEIGII